MVALAAVATVVVITPAAAYALRHDSGGGQGGGHPSPTVSAPGGSGSTVASGSTGGSGSTGDVNLVVWHNSATGEGKAFWEKLASDYHAAHPNVTLEPVAIPSDSLGTKLQIALQSPNPPDVFLESGGAQLASMIKAGQVMDLTDGITPETRQLLGEGPLKSATVDGKVWAMPSTVVPSGFFYSKTLFAKAGITTPPTTMADLDADVARLKAAGLAPIALGAKDMWPVSQFYSSFVLRECSTATITEQLKKVSLTDPCWVTAAADLRKLAATKPFNQGFLTTSALVGASSSTALLANHKAALELMGSWEPALISTLTPGHRPMADLGWFPFPTVPGGAGEAGTMLGGIDGFSCSAKAPKEACTSFLDFLASADVQKQFYNQLGLLPLNSAAQTVVTDPNQKTMLAAVHRAPFVGQWLDTLLGATPGYALNHATADLLAGRKDPDGVVQAVRDAAANS